MTKRECVEAAMPCYRPDRVPYVPAIYEHKAALIDASPSEICRNAELLYQGVIEELRIYDADMLVIGVDVYNVEAEALGCSVVYFDDTNDCPAIVDPIIDSPTALTKLRVPDPENDARMPMYLEVAGRLQREVGERIVLRGAVTGPYSMAAELIGAERFVLLTVEAPDIARQAIEFCARVTVEFGKAFLRRGVSPIIFDSGATPALASPHVVRNLLVPVYRDHVFPELKKEGGRAISAADHRRQYHFDHRRPDCNRRDAVLVGSAGEPDEVALVAHVPIRANVDAVLVNRGPAAAIRAQAVEILSQAHHHPGFLLGCGVVAHDGNPEHVHVIRNMIDEAATGRLDSDRELAVATEARLS